MTTPDPLTAWADKWLVGIDGWRHMWHQEALAELRAIVAAEVKAAFEEGLRRGIGVSLYTQTGDELWQASESRKRTEPA